MIAYNFLLSILTLGFVLIPLRFEISQKESKEGIRIVKIQMEDFPKSLELIIPEEFTLPSTTVEKKDATNYLNVLSQNKARKAKYTHILMTDWNAWPSATILVGSLGSLKSHQGKISKSEWGKLKQFFSKLTETEAYQAGEEHAKNLEENSVAIRPDKKESFVNNIKVNTNSIAVFGESLMTFEEIEVKLWTATKMIYHDKYIISTIIMIDQDQTESQSLVKRYVKLIDFQI